MRSPLLALAALAVLAPPLAAQDHAHPAGEAAAVGRVAFEVSCRPEVRPRFERAVAMMHSFWFEAADAEFAAVHEADPDCAMAHWGRALTLMGNPMTRQPPPADNLRRGAEQAERAAFLAGGASHREQMYIEAVTAYYRDAATRPHLERMALHEQAFDALRRAHPEDMEATIFYARTVVANASPADRTFARQIMAAELMEPLFEAHPAHPGLAHYLIHAFDAPPVADRAAAAAAAYASIAPAAPHALHMPSHIFTRLGQWDASIDANQRSARAEPDSNAAVHPMDYLVYAYLQQGREREARAVLDRAVQQPDRFYGGILGYNFAAMPARFALERSAWAEAAALRLPVGGSPFVHGVTRFARAVGAARSGNVAQAQEDVTALASLKAELDAAGDGYWATIVEAQRQAAQAWVTHAGGDPEGALGQARAAADLEETVEKHPVTPGPLLPARELLGDLLMAGGRMAEAQAEYERTLQREPGRLRARYGAAQAAAQAGNQPAARAHYTALLDLMGRADASRPEPAVARRFLAEHGPGGR